MRKYLWIIILVMIAALALFLLWGRFGRQADGEQDCLMANAKAEQFQRALDEFGAMTPEEAALLWSKGVQVRNGALQYAVMSDELKKVYKEIMDKNSPAWVTGFSSPWVEKYSIIESTRLSKEEYIVTLKFSTATSTGPAGEHLVKLSLYYDGQFWVINNVDADKAMLAMAGFVE